MKVAVGSKNPVKIAAVKSAFEIVFKNEHIEVIGLSVDSGMSGQPMSDEDSIVGAIVRAKNALLELNADFGVGLEAGIQQIGENYFDSGWVAIVNTEDTIGLGSTLRMIVPKKVVDYIELGHELGEAMDYFYQRQNSKQAEGHFGLMTNGILDRKNAFKVAVISSLARFISPQMF